MTPLRSWKVNIPKPLSTSSRPILKRPANIESKVEKKEEKIEKKDENEKKETEKKEKIEKKIEVVLQTKCEHTTREWSAIMFSILTNLNNIKNINKIIQHLDTIPYFFKETGMFTMSLDLVISRIKVDVQDVVIESYYKNTNMADDIFLDDIATWPETELLFYF